MDYNLLVNALIFLIFSILKSQGLSDEEAKIQFYAKVDRIKALPPLPMDEA